MTRKISRREFMRSAGLGALGLVTPYVLLRPGRMGWTAAADLFAFDPNLPPEDVFGLSVASGDPTAAGVILWTRVNEDQWQPGTQLAFEVALDEVFSQIVAQGVVDSADFDAASDYTVKLDLDGSLSSGGVFYYRFIYQQTASQIGRCRTLPAANSSPASLKLGLLTCQHYTNGYYGALHHLAQEDVDFVLHVGDFIYESGSTNQDYPGHVLEIPGGSPATGLEAYRYLYRAYHSDHFMQEVMARHTFIIIWDDHEMANDCYWDYDLDAPGAPDHPFADNPAALTQLKLDSQRAWAEYVPARPQIDPNATHPHDYLTIYRRFQFGDLADIFMTDERTYRTPHPCGESTIGGRYVSLGCPMQSDPTQIMLGQAQHDWLVDGLLNSAAVWKLWGNEVIQMQLIIPRPNNPDGDIFLNLDAWDGYEHERQNILTQLRDAGIKNLVVLTGDLHSYLAGYLKIDYADSNNNDPNNVIGVEFMTPAVTSSNVGEVLADLGLPFEIGEGLVRLLNPHVRFFDGYHWGYSVIELNQYFCEYRTYSVDKAVDSPDAARSLLKRLRVLRDRIRLWDLTGLP